MDRSVMDRRVLRCSASAVMLGVLAWAAAQGAPPPQPTSVRWWTNLELAHEVSLATGKPMLLVFGAEWCVHCEKMSDETFGHPQLASFINKHFVPVRLDMKRHRREAGVLEVSSVPTTVVLTPQADLVGKVVGYVEPPPYFVALESARRLQQQIQLAEAAEPAEAGESE